MFSIGFPILFSPIQLHATIIGSTKPYAKLSQSNLLSNYIHDTDQKSESSRAASLSKLNNTINNNSTFNTKCDELSTKWLVLFHFHSLPCTYKHPYNLYRIFSSANSHLPIPSLLVHKIILLIASDTSFFYTSALLHLPHFCVQESLQSTSKNIFSTSAI